MKRERIKTRPLVFRLSEPEIELIDLAARAVGETRADFVREAAKARALALRAGA